MAEIGLIASVIQVAGAGLKLSQSIYQYADSVASADRRLKDIAKEVRLTSFVIDELARVFKQDETASLLSDNARRTADETVKECSSMFVELDADIKKSRKSKLGRLTLPFREPKIELIRSHIDKLKSTLQLLLGVLTHAYQVASHKRNGEAEAAQREQIKALMQSKKQNEMKYQESLRNFGLSKESTNVGDDDASNEEDTMMSITSIASTITVQSLEACVQHVQGLLTDIEALQKGLSTRALEGPDPSEHQQSLIGSYFRARNFLDTVLLGSTKGFAAADKREKTGSTTARTELSISQEVALSGQPEKRDQQKWPNSDNVRLPPSSHISTDSSALEDAGLQRSSLVRPMMPMRPKRKERDMRAETGKTELVISDAHVPKEQLSFERSCSTCWSRRVRCDETKPACLQCTRTRRRCPGYWILQSASHEEDQGGVGYRRRPSAPAYPPSSPTESDLSSPEPERVKNMFARSSAFEDDGLSSVEAIRPTGYQTGRRDPDLAHLTTEELKDRLLKAETRLAREREAKRERQRYTVQTESIMDLGLGIRVKGRRPNHSPPRLRVVDSMKVELDEDEWPQTYQSHQGNRRVSSSVYASSSEDESVSPGHVYDKWKLDRANERPKDAEIRLPSIRDEESARWRMELRHLKDKRERGEGDRRTLEAREELIKKKIKLRDLMEERERRNEERLASEMREKLVKRKMELRHLKDKQERGKEENPTLERHEESIKRKMELEYFMDREERGVIGLTLEKREDSDKRKMGLQNLRDRLEREEEAERIRREEDRLKKDFGLKMEPAPKQRTSLVKRLTNLPQPARHQAHNASRMPSFSQDYIDEFQEDSTPKEDSGMGIADSEVDDLLAEWTTLKNVESEGEYDGSVPVLPGAFED